MKKGKTGRIRRKSKRRMRRRRREEKGLTVDLFIAQ